MVQQSALPRLHLGALVPSVCTPHCRFQSAAVGLGDKSWAFPKFYDMFKFGELICEFGSVAIASASYGERSHKDFKAAKLFTNNHKATLMNQVCALHGIRQLHPDTIVDTFGRQKSHARLHALRCCSLCDPADHCGTSQSLMLSVLVLPVARYASLLPLHPCDADQQAGQATGWCAASSGGHV